MNERIANYNIHSIKYQQEDDTCLQCDGHLLWASGAVSGHYALEAEAAPPEDGLHAPHHGGPPLPRPVVDGQHRGRGGQVSRAQAGLQGAGVSVSSDV